MKQMLLTLDEKEIESLSQFYFWLHRCEDQENPCTDAFGPPDENGKRYLMTIEEMAEDYEADKVFSRIDEAWHFMHAIGPGADVLVERASKKESSGGRAGDGS